MAIEAEIAEGGRLRAFRRVAALDGLEVLQADFGRYRFPAHAHDRDVISLIDLGSHSVERDGSRTVAGAGSVVMMPRGRVHAGGNVDETGWRILTLYLPERLLDDAAGELVGGVPSPDQMPERVTRDRRLCRALTWLHGGFLRVGDRTDALLGQHEALLAVLGYALRSYGPGRDARPLGAAPRAVSRACDHLHAHWAEPVTLAELSAVAGLSPSRLARVFKAATGLPPHAYQVQLRVARAQEGLRAGCPIAEVALDCGFADQSHLTRVFKRSLGFTPGQFRKG